MASRTRNSKGIWAVSIAAAVVLGLTAYVTLSGDDEDPGPKGKGGASPSVSGPASPSASYQAPEDWTEPQRWAALPRGERTDGRGSETGFPHTTQGAVAMAAANSTSIEAGRSNVDEQLRIYRAYVAKADQSPDTAEQIELQAIQTDKALHKSMNVAVGQPLPAGAYVRTNVVGFKVIKESSDEVAVFLLSRVVRKNGETAKETSSYTRVVNGVRWEGGDWKLSGTVTQEALSAARKDGQPKMAAPGDEAFNEAGWTAIREAS
ncbi:hypothetical protein ACFXDO_18960 [Streptomyces nigra]|uniref:hypothetical protein n=1 Tax=Streptomyces nigra TaxID=1827580 RepID=UPI0036A4B0F7